MSTEPAVPGEKQHSQTNLMSVLQLVFSLVIFLLFLGGAVLAARLRVGVLPLASAGLQGGMLWSYSIALLMLALLCLPSIISSICTLTGGTQPRWLSAPMPALNWLPLALFVLVLVVRMLVMPDQPAGVIWPAVLTALAIALPAFWLLRLGAGKTWGQHAERNSGLLTFSFGFTTYFIMIVELVLVCAVVTGFLAAVAQNQAWFRAIQQLLLLYQRMELTPEKLNQLFMPLLSAPSILLGILLLVSLAIPLIEEAFKTLGVWLLKDRGITPVEGYLAGLVSGAGFALMEGLLNSPLVATGAPADWLVFALGRLGGTLLHIFNGGLMGWALARHWQDKEHHKVWGTYLLVVVLHGLWNAIAILGLNLQTYAMSETLTYSLMGIYLLVLLVAFILFSRSVHRQTTEVALVAR